MPPDSAEWKAEFPEEIWEEASASITEYNVERHESIDEEYSVINSDDKFIQHR